MRQCRACVTLMKQQCKVSHLHKTELKGNVYGRLLLGFFSSFAVAVLIECRHPENIITQTQRHTHTAISIYQISAYSSLVSSIYSGVHLGEPKLIEVHHNGLFISHWTDRATPSFALSHSAPTSFPPSCRYEERS